MPSLEVKLCLFLMFLWTFISTYNNSSIFVFLSTTFFRELNVLIGTVLKTLLSNSSVSITQCTLPESGSDDYFLCSRCFPFGINCNFLLKARNIASSSRNWRFNQAIHVRICVKLVSIWAGFSICCNHKHQKLQIPLVNVPPPLAWLLLYVLSAIITIIILEIFFSSFGLFETDYHFLLQAGLKLERRWVNVPTSVSWVWYTRNFQSVVRMREKDIIP